MSRKRIKVIKKSDTGRNIQFRDNYTRKVMTDEKLVKEIKEGNYPNYHIRNINHRETPVSNPDKSKDNNLG